MIETINALIILCAMFGIIFMLAKSIKEDSDFRKREIELALKFYPEGYAYVNNILNGFDETVIEKTKGVNMSDFKVGDWVKFKHTRDCVMRLIKKTHDGYWECNPIGSLIPDGDLINESILRKVYPKFDKFDDLFSETPCNVDEANAKFKIGDKVTCSLVTPDDEIYTIACINIDDDVRPRYCIKGEFSFWFSEEYLTKCVEKEDPRFDVGERVISYENITKRKIATIIKIFFYDDEYIYQPDCIDGLISELCLFKLNDPKILRVGDKVKYVGGKDNYFMKKGTILLIKKINELLIGCLYINKDIELSFDINPKYLELILD